MNVKVAIEMDAFAAGLAKLAAVVKREMPVVLKKEAGELIKTLVRVTPPADPDKTRSKIAAQVSRTFEGLNRDITYDQRGHLNVSVHWYAWDRNYLFGVQADKDMTKAGLPEIKRVFLSAKNTAGSTRQIVQFEHPRKHQRVAIAQRILTTKKQNKNLIAYLKGHVGRLKSGWLVAVGSNVVTLSGGNMPPKWVTRHMAGARGYVVDETKIPNAPSLTIANTAAGVGNKKNNLDWLVKNAMGIRAKAMAKNATLFMQGKKNLGDYK